MNNQTTNVQVFVRIKPTDKKNARSIFQAVSSKKVFIKEKSSDKSAKVFSFDKIFDADTTQETIFNDVMSPIINNVLEGYNCTTFAYGQAGTGKTFTIEGQNVNSLEEFDQTPECGFMARSLLKLFDKLESCGCEYALRISHLAIINEELIDLLSSGDKEAKLKLMDDSYNKGAVVVHGLEEIIVHDKKRAFQALQGGCARRRLGLQNSQTSRSHGIFTITVHFKKSNSLGEEYVHVGKLNLVDLASTEVTSGSLDSLRDVGKSNQSLLTLRRTIMALDNNDSHIPYRESKLTRLLQDSLGGSTKTCIIATVSSDPKDLDETLCTLNLMYKAKNISNKLQQNKRLTTEDLKWYAEELSKLQRELDSCRGQEGFYISADGYSELLEKITRLTDEKQKTIENMNNLTKEYNKKKELFVKKCLINNKMINTDFDKLFRKNNNLMNIVRHNKKMIESFQEKCSEDVRKVSNLIDNTTSEITEFKKFKDVLSGYFDSVKTNINDLCAMFVSELVNLDSRVKEHHNKVEVFMKSYIEETSRVKEVYKKTVCDIVEKFTIASNEYESKTSASVKQKYNDVIKLHEEKMRVFQSGLISLLEKSETLKENVIEMGKKDADVFQKIIDRLKILMKNNCEVVAIAENDATEKHLVQSSACNKASLKLINELHCTALKIAENINSLRGLHKDTASKIVDVKLKLHSGSETCANIITDQTEKYRYVENSLLEHKNNIDSNCMDVLEREIQKIPQNLINRNTILEENINLIGNIMESIKNEYEAIVISLEDYEIKNKNSIALYISEINDTIDRMKVEKTNVISHIDTLQGSINILLNDELKSYVPTGETPKRQSYDYQQELKGTSPQERLRKRFKDRLHIAQSQ